MIKIFMIFIMLFTNCIIALNYTYAQVPNWLWAKGANDANDVPYYDNLAYGVSIDKNDNIIVAGSFSSSSIIFGTDTLINTSIGHSDIFLVKYDALGNVQWARKSGGILTECALSVTTDLGSNILITGFFISPNLVFGSDTLINSASYTEDIFIAKYDASGNPVWARSIRGDNLDMAYHITTDAFGNVLLTGQFKSSSIILGSDTLNNIGLNHRDIIIAKYSPSGNLLWGRSVGGSLDDYASCITSDINNNVIVIGSFESSSLIFGTDTLLNSNSGIPNVFIAKYNSQGNILWAKCIGNISYDNGISVASDLDNNIIITGYFYSPTLIFGVDTLLNAGGAGNIFIAKYDSLGNELWVKQAWSTSLTRSTSINVDFYGNIFMTGYFANASSIIFGTDTLEYFGVNGGVFIVKYDIFGNVLWAKQNGGIISDSKSMCITSDSEGNAIITGHFGGQFIIFGSDTIYSNNNYDIFVAKLSNVTFKNELTSPSSNIFIYPNPTNNYLNIEFMNSNKQIINSKYEIFDLDGRLLQNQILHTINTKISMNSLKDGIYILKIKNEKELIIKKIVKQ